MHGQSIRHDRYQLGVNLILVFLVILQIDQPSTANACSSCQ